MPRSYYDSSTSSAQADFPNLASQTGSVGLREYPNNFVFSGRWAGTAAETRGTSGDYWTSTSLNANYACVQHFDNSSTRAACYNQKYHGYTIRCVTGGS